MSSISHFASEPAPYILALKRWGFTAQFDKSDSRGGIGVGVRSIELSEVHEDMSAKGYV